MKTHLALLLNELDRADIGETTKEVLQREIELHLGRHAREILKMATMTRFAGQTAEMETAFCGGCQGRFHYTKLDDRGLCEMCRPDSQHQVDAACAALEAARWSSHAEQLAAVLELARVVNIALVEWRMNREL